MAIKAGARGYLLKDDAPEQIVQAIPYVASGGTITSPRMASKLLDEFKRPQHSTATEELSSLSEREQEVLRLVAQGESNKEIVNQLMISANCEDPSPEYHGQAAPGQPHPGSGLRHENRAVRKRRPTK